MPEGFATKLDRWKNADMFTLDQIEKANSKVRSGADFPALVKELKEIGVFVSDVFVRDGHAEYFGKNHVKLSRRV